MDEGDIIPRLVNLEFRSILALRGFSRVEIGVIVEAHEAAKVEAVYGWLHMPDADERKEVKKMNKLHRIMITEPSSATQEFRVVSFNNAAHAIIAGVENTGHSHSHGGTSKHERNVELIIRTDDEFPGDGDTPPAEGSIEVGYVLLRFESEEAGEPQTAVIPNGYAFVRMVEFDSGAVRGLCARVSL